METSLACFDEVKAWMSVNFFSLNESKMELILLGPSELHGMTKIKLGTLTAIRKHQVKNLSVVCDSALKFDKQIKLLK